MEEVKTGVQTVHESQIGIQAISFNAQTKVYDLRTFTSINSVNLSIMKKQLLAIAALLAGTGSFAQFGTAPDFSVVDLDGNTINLYADILDQGMVAVVDVSATWCGPCWSLHQSHALEDLHQAYGPNGTNQLRVIFYEGDANTTLADLQGTGGSTIGNWLEGSSYPFVNESPLSLNLNIWAPLGFPTVNIVRPGDYEIVADTWNILSFEGQVNAINNANTGITLGAVNVAETAAEAAVNLYPNPTNGVVTLNLQGFTGQAHIEVIDMIGQQVAQRNTAAPQEVVDLSNLAAGTYIVRVRDNQHEVVRRVVLNK
jgi:thiol-disulfide isomerase/thioredoxin